MKLSKLFLMMLAAILSIGLVVAACGDDDDDDDSSSGDDDTTGGGDDDSGGTGDPAGDCEAFYTECGIDDGYCESLSAIDMTNSCYATAINNLFACLNGTACDSFAVVECLTNYSTEALDCI
jgi:hypothetical protein